MVPGPLRCRDERDRVGRKQEGHRVPLAEQPLRQRIGHRDEERRRADLDLVVRHVAEIHGPTNPASRLAWSGPGSGDQPDRLRAEDDQPDTGLGAGGTLRGGAWEWINQYEGFGAWTHVVSAGNGFVLFYDTKTGNGAWGTLDGGAWEYYGTL